MEIIWWHYKPYISNIIIYLLYNFIHQILVSMDGFRSDFIERGLTPTLATLAKKGVYAPYMKPSYPTITFPNHYSIVTVSIKYYESGSSLRIPMFCLLETIFNYFLQKIDRLNLLSIFHNLLQSSIIYGNLYWSSLFSPTQGLIPPAHGIIANRFTDPVFNASFAPGKPTSFQKRFWGGEPIWKTVENQVW